jgi:DNA polymerase
MRDHETGKTGYAFTHPTGKGVRLWRGILIENVVQGAARDLLAYSLPKLEAAELPVVAHVHDESIVDGSHFDEVRAIMTELPGWANGLPLDADGDVKERYAK